MVVLQGGEAGVNKLLQMLFACYGVFLDEGWFRTCILGVVLLHSSKLLGERYEHEPKIDSPGG